MRSGFRLGSLVFSIAALLSLAPAVHSASPKKPAAKPAASPKKPSGPFFRLDKVTSTFSHACGFRVAGDKTGETETVVIFASVPLDCAAADAGFSPQSALESSISEQRGAIVVMTLDPEGTRANGYWRSIEPSDGFSFGGQGELTFVRRDDTRVEGRYRTLKPEDFFDKTFEFDLPFAVDLLAGSLSGTPLPKNGGEPGKVYLAYLKAVDKKDPVQLQKWTTAARAAEIKEQAEGGYFAETFEYRRSSELKTATITGGLVKGNKARLDVSGVTHDGDKSRGPIYLVQENGAWKVESQALALTFE